MRAFSGDGEVTHGDVGPGPAGVSVADRLFVQRDVALPDRVLPWRVAGTAVVDAPPRPRSLPHLRLPRPSMGAVEMSAIAAADLVSVVAVVLAVGGSYLSLVLPAVALWIPARLYSRRCHLSVLDDLPRLAGGVAIACLVGLSLPGARPLEVALTAAALLSLIVVSRAVTYLVLRRLRIRGHLQLSTVVVGSGERTAGLIERTQGHPEYGLNVIGVLGDAPPELLDVVRLGNLADLSRLGADRMVDAVLVGDATGAEETLLLDALRARSGRRIDVLVMPRLSEVSSGLGDQVWGTPLYRVTNRRAGVGFAIKRTFDVLIASLMLVLVLPLLALAALAVRVELGRGVLFRQERIGQHGRPFELLKFRSMRDLREGAVSAWATDADRMGRVGAFIRRYSVDELPQLLNVVRGDMSLVGPRPERPEYVAVFGQQIPTYRHRHRVPVGLTGMAAVQGLRGDTSIVERAYFDNWYIENWSLWLDIKILVRTGLAVIRGTGR